MEPRFMGSATARVLSAGPLREEIDGFVAALRTQGYRASSARSKLIFVAQLSQWLERRDLAVGALDRDRVGEFLQDRRRRYRGHAAARATAFQLLQHLRTTGAVAPTRGTSPPDAASEVEAAYREYLHRERGLADITIDNYVALMHPFLANHPGSRSRALTPPRAGDVTRFVMRQSQRMGPGRAKLLVTALRSLLRFLHVTGKTATDLTACVPTVADWRHTTLPKFIPAAEVQRLIASCDRETASGRRDRAVLLLLARLGLRAGEVVRLTLDDIDWGAGELLVRGKGARHDRLPLPRDVGEAVVEYLRSARLPCSSRHLFVCARAPRHGFSSAAAVSTIVRRAIERTGLRTPTKGAHLLRHSLATDLLRRGAGLSEIGELLRHRSPDTTALYAKVDLAALRDIAPPWPGGAA